MSFFYEVAHLLMVRKMNDFHSSKSCTSHNGIVWGQIVGHWELYIQVIEPAWTGNKMSPRKVVISPLNPNRKRPRFSRANGE